MTAAVRIPDRTQVLVIGGGIIGCSVAHHLTRRGITDECDLLARYVLPHIDHGRLDFEPHPVALS